MRAPVVIGLLCSFLIAACGGLVDPGSGTQPAPKKTPPPDDGDDLVVQKPSPPPAAVRQPLDMTSLDAILAKRWVACHFDGEYIAWNGYGGEAGFAAELDRNEVERQARPGITMTQAEVDACAEKLRGAPCWAWFPECTFRGSLPDGAGCKEGRQCASGACTDFLSPVGSGGFTCGVCVPEVGLREACDDDGPQCAFGLTCRDHVCRERVGIGESCEDAPCAHEGFCDDASKKCVPYLREGDTCVEGQFSCGYRLHCTDGKCVAPLPVKPVALGGRCAPDPAYRVTCVRSWCDHTREICTAFAPPLQLGEVCTENLDPTVPDCGPGLECDGVCKPYVEPVCH